MVATAPVGDESPTAAHYNIDANPVQLCFHAVATVIKSCRGG